MRRVLVSLVLALVMSLSIVSPALAIGITGNFCHYNFVVTQGETIYPINVGVTVFTSGDTTFGFIATTETPAGIIMLVSPTTGIVDKTHPCPVYVTSVSASTDIVPGVYIVYLTATETAVDGSGNVHCIAAVRFPATVTVLADESYVPVPTPTVAPTPAPTPKPTPTATPKPTPTPKPRFWRFWR